MGSKDAALTFANETYEVTPHSVYCDGSGFEGGIGASAIMYTNGQEIDSIHYHLGPISKHTVYEAEIIGLMLGLHLLFSIKKISHPHLPTILGTDSQATIKDLNNQKPHPAYYLLDHVHDTAKKLHIKQYHHLNSRAYKTTLCYGNPWKDQVRDVITLQLIWTPGHINFAPNE